ncbi:MAG: 16S rRNA (cytosine(1402)-N(4))-methyltransferase RsmH [Chloroflexi bacterium]|nr:16S rRNA (cytosine(1402)-N(4))-methyltransferase RsmH [Chloroflexota bacterium]
MDTGASSDCLGVIHNPVLLEECLRFLNPRPGGRYIDCTLGTGGHAIAILDRSLPRGRLLGIDADPAAIGIAGERLRPYGSNVTLVSDNFCNLQEVWAKCDFGAADGILFDLGMSALQLEDRSRGFSFRFDAPLDMRFAPTQHKTASAIVNELPESELAALLRTYGEERRSRAVARNIVANRPINDTLQLANVIKRIMPRGGTLRIAVNQEIDSLGEALRQTIDILAPGGRLAVISYHSLEDRVVKQFMRRESLDCLCPPRVPVCACGHTKTLKMVTRKVVTPSSDEIGANPRSRSARLRVAERL